MKIFSNFYARALLWSKHPRAQYYLVGVSFAESFFFFFPADLLLVSMSLAKPKRAWRYALLTTVASVIGGTCGYLLGGFFFQAIIPFIAKFGMHSEFDMVLFWFREWGFWAVLLGGFLPVIPFKVFTISSGALQMPYLSFLAASIVARGCRFFLEGFAMYYYGERLRYRIHRYIDYAGWGALLLLLLSLGIYELYSFL